MTARIVVQTADEEMALMLLRYQAWESRVRSHLRAHGAWCDSVDPRTARAMRGTPGAPYSEAIGAQVFLRYPVRTAGLCSMVVHPQHGVHTYPATLFTTAPLAHVQAALAAARHVPDANVTRGPSSDGDSALLDVRAVTLADARGEAPPRCAACGVSFSLRRGQHIVVQGAPGVGKSTLMLALRGLVPLAAGEVAWGRGVRAMFVSQTALQAPSASLHAQLAYPSDIMCTDEEVVALLETVGLGYLRGRQGELSGTEAAGGPLRLSSGEMQCLAVARVLRSRPHVALLDEAFAAVPADVETRLMRALADAGVSTVLVSHREASARSASAVLTLGWQLPSGWVLQGMQHEGNPIGSDRTTGAL